MGKRDGISGSVIKRLPRYYRFLSYLIDDGVVRISSKELSRRMGLTASQIRQDLNCFGGFGQQGYGYNVQQLYLEIGQILGLNRHYKAILIGAGNMGRALAAHVDFSGRGFSLIGVFDNKESMAGQMVRGLPVRMMNTLDDFCRLNNPVVAIMTIPAEAATELTPVLISLGITGFWNFTNYDIATNYPETCVQNVHLEDSLMRLCYQVNEKINMNMNIKKDMI